MRAKMPHTLSYPVGAEIISEGLIGVPQFSEVSLEFRYWNQLARHHGTATPYRVIAVHFSGAGGYRRSPWTVSVDAAPRGLRHLVQKKIVAEALPAIRSWLMANSHSPEREGGHGLVFLLDEFKDELVRREHASMRWRTIREV